MTVPPLSHMPLIPLSHMNKSGPQFTMLDSNNGRSFSPVLFIFQIVAVPAGALVLGLIAGEAIDAVFGRGGHQLAIWLCYAVAGFTQGYLTQAVFPRSDRSGGRFVWVAPVCILVLCFLDEYRSPQTDFADFFKWNPYSFLKGFTSVVFTLPAFASCIYPLGIVAAKRTLVAARG